jgi:hypothetical protein
MESMTGNLDKVRVGELILFEFTASLGSAWISGAGVIKSPAIAGLNAPLLRKKKSSPLFT